MEANPISVILVKSDSKGDRLLFRYPYAADKRQECAQQNRRKNPYALIVTEDILQGPPPQSFNIDRGHLTGFTDEVLSNLFAVKQELCDRKFELKVNDVRFIGHPTLLHSNSRIKSSPDSKQNNPSIVLINIVFALQSIASHSIVKCYYDLSKRLGIALRHEERRCGYVSQEMKAMIAAHDEVAARQEEDGGKCEETESPFDLILQRCSLAKDLRSAFDNLTSSGLVRLRINRWIELSFCLPQKVHQFHKKGFMIDPESIDRCLLSLRPYHGLLLLVEPNQLRDSLPPDASPALLRLIKMYSPLKSLQTLSADADLTLAQVFNLTGHLVYWGNAIVIYPLCESNVYVIAPDAPTHADSPLVEKFSEHFLGSSLLQPVATPTESPKTGTGQQHTTGQGTVHSNQLHAALEARVLVQQVSTTHSSPCKIDMLPNFHPVSYNELKCLAAQIRVTFKVMSEFSLGITVRHKMSPLSHPDQQTQLVQMIVWMLQHRLLLQLHTYIYFMPTQRGLSVLQENGQWSRSGGEDSLNSTTADDTLSLDQGGGSEEGGGGSDALSSCASTETEAGSSEDSNMARFDALGAGNTTVLHVVDGMTTVQTEQNSWLLERSADTGSDRDEVLPELSEEERVAILKLPAVSSPEDLRLLTRLLRQGYLQGMHHLEEIMYLENVRRSTLLQLLDKFREVLVTCETEDPAIAMFYSHSY